MYFICCVISTGSGEWDLNIGLSHSMNDHLEALVSGFPIANIATRQGRHPLQ